MVGSNVGVEQQQEETRKHKSDAIWWCACSLKPKEEKVDNPGLSPYVCVIQAEKQNMREIDIEEHERDRY